MFSEIVLYKLAKPLSCQTASEIFEKVKILLELLVKKMTENLLDWLPRVTPQGPPWLLRAGASGLYLPSVVRNQTLEDL